MRTIYSHSPQKSVWRVATLDLISIICHNLFPQIFSFLAPPVSIQIIECTSGIAGKSFDLICRTLGAENLNPSVIYRWTKNSDRGQIQVGSNSSTLSFNPAHLSDAASYSCTVTIASGYLTSGVHVTAMMSQSVRIQGRFTILVSDMGVILT